MGHAFVLAPCPAPYRAAAVFPSKADKFRRPAGPISFSRSNSIAVPSRSDSDARTIRSSRPDRPSSNARASRRASSAMTKGFSRSCRSVRPLKAAARPRPYWTAYGGLSLHPPELGMPPLSIKGPANRKTFRKRNFFTGSLDPEPPAARGGARAVAGSPATRLDGGCESGPGPAPGSPARKEPTLERDPDHHHRQPGG